MPATACRMHALDAALYSAPQRPRARMSARWRAVWRRYEADTRLDTYRPAQRRAMRAALLALHTVRDYLTGLIDADLRRIADAADYGVTVVREAMEGLWMLGYLEVIPRRRWDPDARPEGWRGRGKWLQTTNAYETRLPDEPPRWPAYQPEGVEWTADAIADVVEVAEPEAPPLVIAPMDGPITDSAPGFRAPSYLTDIHSLTPTTSTTALPQQPLPLVRTGPRPSPTAPGTPQYVAGPVTVAPAVVMQQETEALRRAARDPDDIAHLARMRERMAAQMIAEASATRAASLARQQKDAPPPLILPRRTWGW